MADKVECGESPVEGILPQIPSTSTTGDIKLIQSTETDAEIDDGFDEDDNNDEEEDDDDDEENDDTDWLDIDDMIDLDDVQPVSEDTKFPKFNHAGPIAETTPLPSYHLGQASSAPPLTKKQKLMKDMSHIGKTVWDPFNSYDWDREAASVRCISRLKGDLTEIFKEAPPMINVVPEENDITKLHALIRGPAGTPYEGGFFYFFLRAPPLYPLQPPRVKLLTTGSETVRFNPNLYRNGKVCLSTLGTWTGPPWSPAQSLLSLLLSIQSLMNEKPYHNEPGYEKINFHLSDQYNECIAYKTLCAAACQMADGGTISCSAVNQRGHSTQKRAVAIPTSLQELVEQGFVENRDLYKSIIEKYKHLEGKPLQDPFRENTGVFKFADLQQRMDTLHEKLSVKLKEEEEEG